MMKNKYCIANWKMNMNLKDSKIFFSKFKKKNFIKDSTQIIICPSFTQLDYASKLLKSTFIQLGAQNVYYKSKGNYTGEVSCNMLKELECEWIIVGHSERRINFDETNKIIYKKIKIILNERLNPILCIGENKDEQNNNITKQIIKKQLSVLFNYSYKSLNNLIIAYEPVWAIGTGVSATIDIVQNNHAYIRKILAENIIGGSNIPILYGGSVNAKNAHDLSNLTNVDGFLIGSSSLDSDEFYKIYKQI